MHIIKTTPVFPVQQVDHLKAARSLVALSTRVTDVSSILQVNRAFFKRSL